MSRTTLRRWLHRDASAGKKLFSLDHTRLLLEDVTGEEMHLARVRWLANGVAGVLNASLASIAAISQAYAALADIGGKSGVKQVDRLLSNKGIALRDVIPLWIRHVIGDTPKIVVAMDWTDFDDDDHTALVVSVNTTHGRATPLAWRQGFRLSGAVRVARQLGLALHNSVSENITCSSIQETPRRERGDGLCRTLQVDGCARQSQLLA